MHSNRELHNLSFLFRHTRIDDDQHFVTVDEEAEQRMLEQEEQKRDIEKDDLP